AGLVEVDEVFRFDQAIGTAWHLEEYGLVIVGFRERIQHGAADNALAALDLGVVERGIVSTVGDEGDEALGAVTPKVEGFIQTDVLEVPGSQDGEEAHPCLQLDAAGGKDLASERDGVRHGDRLEVQVALGEMDAVCDGRV